MDDGKRQCLHMSKKYYCMAADIYFPGEACNVKKDKGERFEGMKSPARLEAKLMSVQLQSRCEYD